MKALEEGDAANVERPTLPSRPCRLADKPGLTAAKHGADQLVELRLLRLRGQGRCDSSGLVTDCQKILLPPVARDPLEPFLQLTGAERACHSRPRPRETQVVEGGARLAAAMERAEEHVALDRAGASAGLERQAG